MLRILWTFNNERLNDEHCWHDTSSKIKSGCVSFINAPGFGWAFTIDHLEMVEMSKRNLKGFLLALALLVLPAAPYALSDETDDIHQVITKQLEAFKRDDGMEAYSYAAPMIQEIFPSQENFMQMVKQGYPQVYRPRNYAFTSLERKSDGFAQMVMITDENGRIWNALYFMQRQPDGSWKIAGCQIMREITTS